MMKKRLASVLFGIIMLLSLPITTFAESTDNIEAGLETNSTQTTIVNLGTNIVELKDGQHVKIPLIKESGSTNNSGVVQPNDIFYGDAGYVEIWVSGNHVNYSIVMYTPANRFLGSISITDLTSGLSSGTDWVTGFSEYGVFSKKSGHMYSAIFTGTAFAGVIPVAYCDHTIIWIS